MNIRKWVVELANTWDHRMKNERQLDIYEDEIRKLELTDTEMESLRLQLVRELDKFPSLSQLVQIGRSATRTKAQPDAAWMMYDRDDKRYATRLPGPPAHDELPAISGTEAREAFMTGYQEGLEDFKKRHGKLNKPDLTAEVFLATSKKPDGPEAIGSVIGRVIADMPSAPPSQPPKQKPKPEIDLLDDLEVEP